MHIFSLEFSFSRGKKTLKGVEVIFLKVKQIFYETLQGKNYNLESKY